MARGPQRDETNFPEPRDCGDHGSNTSRSCNSAVQQRTSMLCDRRQ
eukprot:CAMPEP_0175943250 /NCGR_PEP_ID=MMETSP0108-20121206/25441_1 /TAXON_ID=195067 ORGANISM="Goniomonas pacifica, Strain CCMP1869" /NCGR_SAMPLE_ID=MMETSP0108 /ASSEMBLY_ACC=CAM_ASM_000204 /LENGTH=45 /DNA_ID= /DNA_START= /DNA_END= /DNA_ORIENTATION=